MAARVRAAETEIPAIAGDPLTASAAPPEPDAMLIAPGCELEGSLRIPGAVRISGDFRGALESEASVTIDEGGSAEADIRARTVVIRGAVVGDVDASRECVLCATGRLHGRVRTPSLVVERGAFFSGETQMYRPERVARALDEPGPEPPARPAAAS